MSTTSPTRPALLLAACVLTLAATAQGRRTAPAQTVVQPSAAAERQHRAQEKASTMGKPGGEHLADWMSRHSTLSPEQQQKALEKEPGFKDLPAATQQRMKERLTQLNAMPADKRAHILERNEAMEHLTPEQRGQVRNAMKQLAELPPDDRRYVARTFRGLRELSPAARQNVLNSDRFAHLNDAQRATLNSLMQVEPLLPPPYDAGAAHPQP